MSQTEMSVLATVRSYLGDERIGNPEHMDENWTVTAFRDAWLTRPKAALRECLGFIVRGHAVEPVDACKGNLDQAYQRLQAHLAYA